MAALQTIRNRGKILVAVVFLALLAFIVEEGVRSISYFRNESHQRIGEVYGKSINIQDYNKLVDEYADVIKMSNGMSSLTDEQMTMVRDQVWSTYVQQQIVEHECEKLGLTVTDAELQTIINEGRSELLKQTPFRTQTGAFDANALKNFLAEYSKVIADPNVSADVKEQYVQMNNYWSFIEKSVRQQTLNDKYQSLLSGAIVSNPIAEGASYEARVNEKTIVMAAVPYTAVKDADVTIDDKDLKACYNEKKELFATDMETRSIKYIDIAVKASKQDETDLQNEMMGYAQALAEGADAAKTVREAASQVAYSVLPMRKDAFPHEVAEALDTLAEGAQVGPFYHAHDNSVNVVRLINKTTLPDSVEVRQIFATGEDMAAMEKCADSIMTALNAGENFDSIAKKYNQPAAKNWVTSEQYEGMLIDANNKKFIETITNAAVGSINKIVLDGQGVIIAEVTDRRNMVTKYDAAVIKRVRDFSKDTYNKAFNDFSSFLAGNTNLEDIEANAEAAGYTVQTRQNLASNEHNVANVRSTREAMRWIFNEDTKVGDVSPLYECGDNDHLLCIVLTGINKKGYMPLDDEQVKDYINGEVMKDKKATLLMEKLASAKSIADVMAIEGAVSDTVNNITLAYPAYVSKVAASEPALSGAVSACKKGDFKTAVKGNSAVYAFQVIKENKREEEKDAKKEGLQVVQQAMRATSNYRGELYKKAKVEDKRYLFF